MTPMNQVFLPLVEKRRWAGAANLPPEAFVRPVTGRISVFLMKAELHNAFKASNYS